MFKDYDELRNHIEKVFGENNVIMNHIEDAFEFGHEEGETYGFKRAVKNDLENIDADDLPEGLVEELESFAYDRGRDDGYQSGYDDGRSEGHSLGYDEGYSDGYDAGHTDGYDECKTELGDN